MPRAEDARRAFEKKKLEDAKKAHTKESIAHEERHKSGGRYLRDFVYGALDGTVTTFAVVAGATGATLSIGVILILGLANLIGDGISMGIGNYLGKKSERDFHAREREREAWEVDNIPEGEREEIRQIYARKGFKLPLLEKVVGQITKDKKLWVETMMVEELGIMDDDTSPAKSGFVTFLSFVAVGFIPIAAYAVALSMPALKPVLFGISIASTMATIFVVGCARSLVIKRKWYIAGIEMLLMGGAAAAAAYGIGTFLGGLA